MVSQRKLMIGSFTQTHEEFSINQNNNIQLPLTDWPTSLFTRLYWQVHKSNLLNFKEIIEIRNLASCALLFLFAGPMHIFITMNSKWLDYFEWNLLILAEGWCLRELQKLT